MTEVRIVSEEREGLQGYSVYDGPEWFAHATAITDALRYASDLLHGPGAGPRGSVWRQMEAIERLSRAAESPVGNGESLPPDGTMNQ